MKSKLYRRRTFYAAFAVALVGLAIPVSFALAGSSAVKVPLMYNDNTCGITTKGKSDGTVTFSRDKSGTLTVTVDVKGGDPTNTYYLYLYYAADGLGSCSYWDYFGKIKLDSGGNGHKVFQATGTNGYNDFVFYGYNNSTGNYDDSQIAHLGN